jgi:hypothetical protein
MRMPGRHKQKVEAQSAASCVFVFVFDKLLKLLADRECRRKKGTSNLSPEHASVSSNSDFPSQEDCPITCYHCSGQIYI